MKLVARKMNNQSKLKSVVKTGTALIKNQDTPRGYTIFVNGYAYSVEYSKNIWEEFQNKRLLINNLIYARTASLRMFSSKLEYDTSYPFFKEFLDKGVIRDIPRIADTIGVNTRKLVCDFNKSAVNFKDTKLQNSIISGNESDSGSIVIGMSFGKDSLLSYGLAKEIGLDVEPVFFGDMAGYNLSEYYHKLRLMQKFVKKFNKKVHFIADNTDDIFYYNKLGNDISTLDQTNAMFLFALQLLPIAMNRQSKYIVFGNEQSLNDFHVNDENYKAYPSYDQSTDYTVKLNKKLDHFTSKNNQVMSLIEPLYNVAEIKILSHRYPKLLPFLMSCSSTGSNIMWCSDCPMCAKFYLYSTAAGLKMDSFRFREDMLNIKFWKLYPLFNPNPNRVYEKPKSVRDEQLFAFYLAHKRGAKGGLIELFKKRFLNEAKEREDELYNKFFGIHESKTIPLNLLKKVKSIYKEELTK